MPIFNPSLGPNELGNGNDGAITFDGATTPVAGATLSGATYTAARDIYATSATVNSGIILKMVGFRLFVNGALTNEGTINGNGNNGAATVAGASITATGVFQCAGGAGGTGRVTTGIGATAGGSGGNNICGSAGGNGGTGGGLNTGGAGNTSSAPTANSGGFYHLSVFTWARVPGATGTALVAMNGSGGGGAGGANTGTGTAASGGGGSAAIGVVILCSVLNNTGTISANGGNGGNASVTGDGIAGGGGGGAGGFAVVFFKTLIAQGTITSTGGTGGTGAGTGAGSGITASSGLVLIQKLTI